MAKIIGRRLKILRKSLKMSQKKISNVLGINLKTLQNWEQGVTCPTYENLIFVADTLDVSVDWLLGRTEIKNNKEIYDVLSKTSKYLLNYLEEINCLIDKLKD